MSGGDQRDLRRSPSTYGYGYRGPDDPLYPSSSGLHSARASAFGLSDLYARGASTAGPSPLGLTSSTSSSRHASRHSIDSSSFPLYPVSSSGSSSYATSAFGATGYRERPLFEDPSEDYTFDASLYNGSKPAPSRSISPVDPFRTFASSSSPGLDPLASFSSLSTSSTGDACDICGDYFSRSELDAHRRSHASGMSSDRPHQCSHCDARFTRKYDKDRHELSHSGVRPHECPRCGHGFSRRDALIRHCRYDCTAGSGDDLQRAPTPSLSVTSSVSSPGASSSYGGYKPGFGL